MAVTQGFNLTNYLNAGGNQSTAFMNALQTGSAGGDQSSSIANILQAGSTGNGSVVGSAIGSAAGTAIGGPVGGAVGGLLGSLLGGQNGYLSNFGGFLETGSLSCLGKQAYRKDTLDYLVRDMKVMAEKGPEQLADFIADKVAIYSFDAGRLRSTCSQKWCKSCLNVCTEAYQNLIAQYNFTTTRSTVRWGNDTLDSQKHTLVVEQTPDNTGTTPNGVMTQEQFLEQFGEKLLQEAQKQGYNFNDFAKKAYMQATGGKGKWTVELSGGGGNGVTYTVNATNKETQFPWLLLVIIGGIVYFVSRRK